MSAEALLAQALQTASYVSFTFSHSQRMLASRNYEGFSFHPRSGGRHCMMLRVSSRRRCRTDGGRSLSHEGEKHNDENEDTVRIYKHVFRLSIKRACMFSSLQTRSSITMTSKMTKHSTPNLLRPHPQQSICTPDNIIVRLNFDLSPVFRRRRLRDGGADAARARESLGGDDLEVEV